MTRSHRKIAAIVLGLTAATLTACAGTGNSYAYRNDARYHEFCSGPYRLQPEYCRERELNGTQYLNLNGRSPYHHRGYWHNGHWDRR